MAGRDKAAGQNPPNDGGRGKGGGCPFPPPPPARSGEGRHSHGGGAKSPHGGAEERAHPTAGGWAKK